MKIDKYINHKIRAIIYQRTKAYKIWINDSVKTESAKKWFESGAKSFSDTHDVMVSEICSLPSYKKWWGLKEIYLYEKTEI
jgi:CRISPR/Cas system-associated protein Cas7 (RAMP superfamily)